VSDLIRCIVVKLDWREVEGLKCGFEVDSEDMDSSSNGDASDGEVEEGDPEPLKSCMADAEIFRMSSWSA